MKILKFTLINALIITFFTINQASADETCPLCGGGSGILTDGSNAFFDEPIDTPVYTEMATDPHDIGPYEPFGPGSGPSVSIDDWTALAVFDEPIDTPVYTEMATDPHDIGSYEPFGPGSGPSVSIDDWTALAVFDEPFDPPVYWATLYDSPDDVQPEFPPRY